jgi:hypothetical protein
MTRTTTATKVARTTITTKTVKITTTITRTAKATTIIKTVKTITTAKAITIIRTAITTTRTAKATTITRTMIIWVVETTALELEASLLRSYISPGCQDRPPLLQQTMVTRPRQLQTPLQRTVKGILYLSTLKLSSPTS